MPVVLDRYLYLNADKSKIVEDGDPEARFTLGGPGSQISDEDARLYGLVEYLAKGKSKTTKPLVEQPAEEPRPERVEGPAKATQPTQNKAQQPGANK